MGLSLEGRGKKDNTVKAFVLNKHVSPVLVPKLLCMLLLYRVVPHFGCFQRINESNDFVFTSKSTIKWQHLAQM